MSDAPPPENAGAAPADEPAETSGDDAPASRPSDAAQPGAAQPGAAADAAQPDAAQPDAAQPAGTPADAAQPSASGDAEAGSFAPLLLIGALVVLGVLAASYLGGGAGDPDAPAPAADVDDALEAGAAAHREEGAKAALSHYQSAYEAAPEDPRTGQALALALVELGRFREALPFAEAAREAGPDEADHHVLYGKILLSLVDDAADPAAELARAEAALERAHELDPEDPEALRDLVLCALRRGELELARERVLAYLELEPEDPDALMELADLSQSLGRPADARDALERFAAVVPEHLTARRRLQDLRVALDGFEAALAQAREAAAAADAGPAERFLLARLLGKHPAHRAEAREHLEAALAEAGEGFDRRWPLLALGIDALRRGEPAAAKAHLGEALALDADFVRARYQLAEAHRLAGEYEAAQDELERVGQAPGYALLALQRRLRCRLEAAAADPSIDPEAVLEVVSGWLEGAPEVHETRYLEAQALRGLGRADDARAILERLRDAAGDPFLWDVRLARLDLEFGDLEAARAGFAEALAEAPGERPSPDLLLWAGVARHGADAAAAEALWRQGAETGREHAPAAFYTFACRRLLGEATAEELAQAARLDVDLANDAAFVEGLARRLAGDAEGAAAAWAEAVEATRAHEWPGRLAERRLPE